MKRNLETALPVVQRRSWECLAFHAEICKRIAAVLAACAEGDNSGAMVKWETLKKFVCEKELDFQREFDVFEFILVWESKILPRLLKQNEKSVE